MLIEILDGRNRLVGNGRKIDDFECLGRVGFDVSGGAVIGVAGAARLLGFGLLRLGRVEGLPQAPGTPFAQNVIGVARHHHSTCSSERSST